MGEISRHVEEVPQHGIVEWMPIQIVYNGLNVVTKQMLDAGKKYKGNHGVPNLSFLDNPIKMERDILLKHYLHGPSKQMMYAFRAMRR